MSGRTGDGSLRLMRESLAALGPIRRPIIVGDGSGTLEAALRSAGAEPCVWLREATAKTAIAPRPWPEGDGFDAALIRLPKARDSLLFALHAAAAATLPGSVMAVFGQNAEGIRSAASRLGFVADDAGTLATGHHARVLTGRRRAAIDGLKGRLEDWRQDGTIDLGGGARTWISYPGTFAKGGLDDGTAFLLANVPTIATGARILDYAAGTGVIAAALGERGRDVAVDMIEADTLALAAARENAPRARPLCGTTLSAAGVETYDLIVSNPPIHDGVDETHAVLERLIADAASHLRPGGELLLVVQRRVPVLPLLRKAFPSARVVDDNGRFTVASARRAAHG